MTQLVVASTLFGAATAASAVDSGLLEHTGGERVLLVVNNAPAPELTPALDEIAGAEPVLRRFDRVVHLTDLLAPVHPSDWRPGIRELPTFERLLRSYWGLGDGPVELVCESLWVNPALALARVFHAAPITVYAEGLMSYGPTRDPLPLEVTQRLDGLVHLDLVPGVRPVLLSEYGVAPTVVPSERFRAVVDEITAEIPDDRDDDGRPAAVVVGQYLAALGLVTRDEEAEMHARMVRAAARAGAQVVRFKPHPSAPPGMVRPLRDAAAEAGVELEVVTDAYPVEVMLARGRHVALVGCFSTALATARTMFGVRTIAVDTETLLSRLTPFQNSNRVPATVIDAVHREDGRYGDVQRLQELVDTVAYCMQPKSLADRREAAVRVLAELPAQERDRYFLPNRLTALDMPGAPKRHPVVALGMSTAQRALRHPALGKLDERTKRLAVRQRLVRRLYG
ncbi:polysialyltransferase family glycosyltransferase [Georgenia alba]|uniref:Polysialyltransferase family glycosyltransferase n=1 Tax=Georgenia alba TaxID=2233858 RepID=A0ABW2Q8S0_9MICO